MRLVVGLGNPGREYEGTRHNVGFDLIDRISRTLNATHFQARMEGLMSESGSGEGKILLLKPQTFMNLSGRCVSKVLQFYKIEASEMMVLCDDKDLSLGKLRIRSSGSHGGNNGLRSIQDHIGLDYPRLKVGIGEPKRGDAAAHVLGRFSGSERTEMEKALDIGAMAVETWLAEGLMICMNRFNAGPDKGSAGRS